MKNNNFDILRIFSAISVVYYHSWPIFGQGGEPFTSYFQYQTPGSVAVAVFFFISGHLLTGSISRGVGIFEYTWSRFLRIIPALFVCVVFSVLIIGPIFTNLTLFDYFKSSVTWNYLKNITVYDLQWNLPGVFIGNPVSGSVNGSLWTLPIEVTFYFLLFILTFIPNYSKFLITLTLVLLYSGYVLGVSYFNLSWSYMGPNIVKSVNLFNFLMFGIYFFFGSFYYIYRNNIPVRRDIGFLCFALLMLSVYFKGGQFFAFILVPYIVYWFAYETISLKWITDRTGDISYGVYIFSFPIQQSLYVLLHNKLDFAVIVVISILLSMGAGFISWHFVEKRVLTYKLR